MFSYVQLYAFSLSHVMFRLCKFIYVHLMHVMIDVLLDLSIMFDWSKFSIVLLLFVYYIYK